MHVKSCASVEHASQCQHDFAETLCKHAYGVQGKLNHAACLRNAAALGAKARLAASCKILMHAWNVNAKRDYICIT